MSYHLDKELTVHYYHAGIYQASTVYYRGPATYDNIPLLDTTICHKVGKTQYIEGRIVELKEEQKIDHWTFWIEVDDFIRESAPC